MKLNRNDPCFSPPHGVLGQTAQLSNVVHPLDNNGLGVIDGKLQDYVETAPFAAQSKFSRLRRHN